MTMVYELLSLVTFIDTEKSKCLVYPTHFTSHFCYHASKRQLNCGFEMSISLFGRQAGRQAKLCRLFGCPVFPIKFVISFQSKPRSKNTSKSIRSQVLTLFHQVHQLNIKDYHPCTLCVVHRYSVCVESTFSSRALKVHS